MKKDIKKIVLLNQVLVENINFFKQILDSIPGSIYWKNIKGIYLGTNIFARRMMKQVQLDYKNIIGKTDYDLFDRLTADEFRKTDIEVMKKKGTIKVEETTPYRNNQNEVHQISIKSPLYDATGSIIGIIGNTIDITDIKVKQKELKEAKEKAEKSDADKTKFLIDISHDIRTPLVGIISSLENLYKTKESYTKNEVKNLILSGNELLKILNDLVKFARKGNKTFDRDMKINLKEIVESICDLFTPMAKNKGIKLIANYDRSIPTLLLGKKVKIHRILLNLVGNAIKFTEHGKVEIEVSLMRKKAEMVYIKIKIQDTGPGIPEDKRELIYEKFVRVNLSPDGKFKGTGLGLASVKQYIDDLGGEINLDSEIDKGSTFTAVIPIKISLFKDDEGETKINFVDIMKSKNSEKNCSRLKKYKRVKFTSYCPTVLVVEDNKMIRMIMKKMLSGMNCRVELAENRDEAILAVTKKRFDVIFMDVGLPGKDGFAITQEIRKIEKAKKRKPSNIAALSAHVDQEYKNRCFTSGMNKTFIKPISIKDTADFIVESIA